MTSVERELGAGSREQELWDETVAAVVQGFERCFDVTAATSRRGVTELRPPAPFATS